jgi:dihydrofolate reductase
MVMTQPACPTSPSSPGPIDRCLDCELLGNVAPAAREPATSGVTGRVKPATCGAETLRTVVAKLKDRPGRELQIHGSGELAQTLFDAGLIDIIRLIVFPVVLGSGTRLFAEGRTPSSFRLADVTSTPSGVTMQTLELTGPPEYGEVEVE